jgi:hypothetical protein
MTTIDVVTIGVDGSLTPETIDNGCTPLQERVGGYIEAVSSDDNEVTLWINEEGKIMGLPVNELGTTLWHVLSPRMAGVDVLCGPVVVSGGTDPEGDTLSIPDKLRRVLDGVAAASQMLADGQVDDFIVLSKSVVNEAGTASE